MKGRSLSMLGIFAAVAAVVLILCHTAISVSGVTITGGILFVAVGLINLMFFSSISKDENATGRILTLITNAAAIVLGLSMLIFRGTFAPLIPFIFGLLIAVCALWQFFVLALGTRPFQLPAWLYIFPVLLASGAVYIFMRKPEGEDALLMLATGISLGVLAIGCIIEGSALGIARRNLGREKRQGPAQTASEPTTQETTVVETPESTQASTPSAPAIVVKKHVETTDDLDDEVSH